MWLWSFHSPDEDSSYFLITCQIELIVFSKGRGLVVPPAPSIDKAYHCIFLSNEEPAVNFLLHCVFSISALVLLLFFFILLRVYSALPSLANSGRILNFFHFSAEIFYLFIINTFLLLCLVVVAAFKSLPDRKSQHLSHLRVGICWLFIPLRMGSHFSGSSFVE